MAELLEQGSGTAFTQCENHSVAPELGPLLGRGEGGGGGLSLRVRGMMMMMEADILWRLKLRAKGKPHTVIRLVVLSALLHFKAQKSRYHQNEDIQHSMLLFSCIYQNGSIA